MVVISFSLDFLIYKVLRKFKQTTIRPLNEKWKDVLDKFSSDKETEIILNIYYKQRSKYGFKLFDTPLEKIEQYNLRKMTLEDAILDGGESIEQLYEFFETKYGKDFLNQEFVRIWWNLDFDKGLKRPNSTKIDWFDSVEQKLFTINPFVFHKNEGKRVNIAKAMQKKRDWINKENLLIHCIPFQELHKKYTLLNEETNVINCLYKCLYCYARNFFVRKPDDFNSGYFEERLKGLKYCKDNVFMCSITDLFHHKLPIPFVRYIIERTNELNINKCKIFYLTKNPAYYTNILEYLNPETDWIGATIETNSYSNQKVKDISSAPLPEIRFEDFIPIIYINKFLSLEPIFEFDDVYIENILKSNIKIAFMGANTSRKNLKHFIEPNKKKVDNLVNILEENGILVLKKHNLNRIIVDGKNIEFSEYSSLIQSNLKKFIEEKEEI